jgi:hypothetical protein
MTSRRFSGIADVEYRGTIAVRTERDNDKVQTLVKQWAALQEDGIAAGIARSSRLSDDYFEWAAEGAQDIFPRTLFAVARYEHGKRALYRGWMGTEFNKMPSGDTISENFFVVEDGKALKMRARHNLCSMCSGFTTAADGSDCPVCDGIGFDFVFGTQVGKLGPMKEFIKFAEPDHPERYPGWELVLQEAKRLGAGASATAPKKATTKGGSSGAKSAPKKASPAKRAARKK